MSTNLEAPFSLTEANALFKTDFKEYADDTYNTDVYAWSKMNEKKMEGKETKFPVPFGYAGGISGTSPGEANVADYREATLTDKSLFARSKIKNQAIDISLTSKGAYVKAMEETITKTVEMMQWFYSFCLFGDGTGTAGTIKASAGVTDNGGGSYTVIVGEGASTFKAANFEERLFYNIGSGETDLFECTLVDESTRAVTFQRQAGGTKVPANADAIFIQKLENAAPMGLEGLGAKVIGGTAYGITLTRRFVFATDSTGGAISHAKINNLVAAVEKKVGKKNMPDTAFTSYTQMAKLNNISESDKRYSPINVKPSGSKFTKTIGFDGIQILTSRGPINVFADKFCKDSDFWLINMGKSDRYQVPGSGWFAKDGTTFLRETDSDSMEARYLWRGENYIPLCYQALMSGLSTT